MTCLSVLGALGWGLLPLSNSESVKWSCHLQESLIQHDMIVHISWNFLYCVSLYPPVWHHIWKQLWNGCSLFPPQAPLFWIMWVTCFLSSVIWIKLTQGLVVSVTNKRDPAHFGLSQVPDQIQELGFYVFESQRDKCDGQGQRVKSKDSLRGNSTQHQIFQDTALTAHHLQELFCDLLD